MLGLCRVIYCLKNAKNHPWMEFMFEVQKMQNLMRASDHYPLFKNYLPTWVAR